MDPEIRFPLIGIGAVQAGSERMSGEECLRGVAGTALRGGICELFLAEEQHKRDEAVHLRISYAGRGSAAGNCKLSIRMNGELRCKRAGQGYRVQADHYEVHAMVRLSVDENSRRK